MKLLTESCWAAPTSLSALPAGSSRRLRPNQRLREPANADRAQRVAGDSGHFGAAEDRKYALPGSLVTRSTACGKPACKCKADRPSCTGHT